MSHDVFNPDPNEGVMCGDCGWVFPRKDLKHVQGSGYYPGKSLCRACIKLRDHTNKQGDQAYPPPKPPEVAAKE